MHAIQFLTSPMLEAVPGLVHGFGQRFPGTRAAGRDAVRTVFQDRGEVFFLNQVHGRVLARAPWSEPPSADASLTTAAGVFLAVETADCLPVLIVDPAGRRAAAVHAGWRGTVARVCEAAVEALVKEGSHPGRLLAVLGPSIGACCYEVGAEVEAAFGSDGREFLVAGSHDRKHLDVAAANRAQLLGAGLDPAHIENLALCTRCREDLFFSYRRDGAHAGRMLSVVGFSAPDASSPEPRP